MDEEEEVSDQETTSSHITALLNLDTGLVASRCHVIPYNSRRDKKVGSHVVN